MRIHGNEGVTITPEDAVVMLRKRIEAYRFRHLTMAVSFAIVMLKLIAKAVVLFMLCFVIFYLAFGSVILFMGSFVLGNLLLYGAAREPLGLQKRNGRGSILVGSSFRHFTESGSRQGTPVAVGVDGTHSIDYLREPNPHVLILGSTSSGKTTTMRSIVSRISLVNGINFMIIDWNGENEEWAKSVNACVWKVPENFKVNLFKLNGMGKEARASMAMEGLVVAARLTALQSTKVKSALLKFYLNGIEPSLLQLWKALCSKNAGKANVLNQRLRAIQRVIGTEPDEFWESVFKRSNVISLMGLNESEKSLVAYTILQRLSELFDREQWQGSKPKLIVVIDEAWQFLRKEKEYDAAKESVAEKIVRLGRKYGVGIVVSTQQIEDIPKVFVNSSSLLMLHQHRETGYYGRDILQLNDFEKEYMRNAAQGEMLLLDRGKAQKGQWYSEYVKVEPLKEMEMQALARVNPSFMPKKIDELEMPIEEHDIWKEMAPQAEDDDNHQKRLGSTVETKLNLPVDMPTPAQYASLLAIYNNPKATLGELVGYVRSKKWFTSPNTLYGSKAKLGMFQNLVAKGMAKEEGNNFALTESGLRWADPEIIMANQADKLGSEEHKSMMRKTITMLQQRLNMVIVSREKHSFDILAFPVNGKKSNLWDAGKAKGYEIQTSARKDSVEENTGKSERFGIPTVWVANKEIIDSIKKLTGGSGQYICYDGL